MELKLKMPDAITIFKCIGRFSIAVILSPLEISNIPVTTSLYVLLEDRAHIKVEMMLKSVVKLKIMAKVLNVSNTLATILLNNASFLTIGLFPFFKSCCIIVLGLNIRPKITEERI